jgi:hypothetical protein
MISLVNAHMFEYGLKFMGGLMLVVAAALFMGDSDTGLNECLLATLRVLCEVCNLGGVG